MIQGVQNSKSYTTRSPISPPSAFFRPSFGLRAHVIRAGCLGVTVTGVGGPSPGKKQHNSQTHSSCPLESLGVWIHRPWMPLAWPCACLLLLGSQPCSDPDARRLGGPGSGSLWLRSGGALGRALLSTLSVKSSFVLIAFPCLSSQTSRLEAMSDAPSE